MKLPVELFWKWLKEEAVRAAGLWLVGYPYAPSVVLSEPPGEDGKLRLFQSTSASAESSIVPVREGSLCGSGMLGDRDDVLREIRLVADMVSKLGSRVTQEGISEAPAQRVAALPTITLTAEEEAESRMHEFRSHLVIEVTGSLKNRRSNEVRLSGTSVILPDAEFLLFLRLIVALYQAEDGYIPRGNRLGGCLVDEGIYPADSVDQVVSRLRSRFGPSLKGLEEKMFVEVRRREIRLSTHRRYVLVNRSRLSHHPDERIRDLAARLPES